MTKAHFSKSSKKKGDHKHMTWAIILFSFTKKHSVLGLSCGKFIVKESGEETENIITSCAYGKQMFYPSTEKNRNLDDSLGGHMGGLYMVSGREKKIYLSALCAEGSFKGGRMRGDVCGGRSREMRENAIMRQNAGEGGSHNFTEQGTKYVVIFAEKKGECGHDADKNVLKCRKCGPHNPSPPPTYTYWQIFNSNADIKMSNWQGM